MNRQHHFLLMLSLIAIPMSTILTQEPENPTRIQAQMLINPYKVLAHAIRGNDIGTFNYAFNSLKQEPTLWGTLDDTQLNSLISLAKSIKLTIQTRKEEVEKSHPIRALALYLAIAGAVTASVGCHWLADKLLQRISMMNITSISKEISEHMVVNLLSIPVKIIELSVVFAGIALPYLVFTRKPVPLNYSMEQHLKHLKRSQQSLKETHA